MDWNKFAQEVHENAVAHGWWDKPISEGEFYTMLHCELAEAVEEYRRGRPIMVYYNCVECGTASPCEPQDWTDCRHYGKESECPHRDPKPMGVAVELADLVLRILDWWSVELAEERSVHDYIAHSSVSGYMRGYERWRFIDVVTFIREFLVRAEATGARRRITCALGDAVGVVDWYLHREGVKLEAVLKLKHQYNKGREFRHGGMLL